MKVYIRRWSNDNRQYVMEGAHQIDMYNGIAFEHVKGGKGAITTVMENTRVRSIFLHPGEANALVVYVEDATKGE